MGKKCIPGVVCFENVTVILLAIIGTMVFYLYYVHLTKNSTNTPPYSMYPPQITATAQNAGYDVPADAIGLEVVSSRVNDPRIELSNPYMPPLKTDNISWFGTNTYNDVRHNVSANARGGRGFGEYNLFSGTNGLPAVGIPINIPTSTANTSYSQTGILTKQGNTGEQMILPLMGRNLMNGRDKWQYYTMTNGAGAINTKLPISVNGKSCTGEYGCDSISTGDIVYVEGYNDTFRATVYENALMQYLPL